MDEWVSAIAASVQKGFRKVPCTELLTDAPGRSRLASTTAIVVGGGSAGPGMGNGRAAAVSLAREGARVVDRSRPAAEETVWHVAADGGTAALITADATVDGECRDAVEAAPGRYGSIDILVNNIGVTGSVASVVDVDLGQWDAVKATHVRSFVLMSRHAIPHMPRGSSVVNVASIAASRGGQRVHYAASKAAILGMTVTMAEQHGPAESGRTPSSLVRRGRRS